MIKDAHQKFIDIIRLLTDLAEQYSLENYLTADYGILHDCTDGLDNAICDLQEESGWLTAVRTLTSLSCTSAIACHIYKERDSASEFWLNLTDFWLKQFSERNPEYSQCITMALKSCPIYI